MNEEVWSALHYNGVCTKPSVFFYLNGLRELISLRLTREVWFDKKKKKRKKNARYKSPISLLIPEKPCVRPEVTKRSSIIKVRHCGGACVRILRSPRAI